jgi:hypothetical protein
MSVKLSYSKAQFNAAKQEKFIEAVAETAMGTSAVSWFPGDVTISKIVDTRRAGSVKFDVTIKATSYNSNVIVSNLSADKLNEKLTAKGLEDAIITSAPVGLDYTDANDKRCVTTDVVSSSSSSSGVRRRANKTLHLMLALATFASVTVLI